jgi:putative DNA primase/helicase
MLEAIGRLAGTYRAVVSPDSITGEGQRDGSKASADIARLHSARFVTVDELPRGTPLRENLIKALTGGTRMTARFNFKDNFEFDPVFTAIMSGNDMPTVSGTDYGIWRRLLIVHWGVTIAEKDRIPFGKLMEIFDRERPGILNWLIRGAERYLNEGLTPFIPAAVTAFTEEYREELDPVGMWVSACVWHGPGYETSTVQAADLYKSFTAWCDRSAVKPWQVTAWGRRLNAMGFTKKRSHNVVYVGVAIDTSLIDKPPAPPPSEPLDPGWKP